MSEQIELMPKELADEPIKVPGNPFWNVFKRFGKDEAIAMVINVSGTAILSMFSTSIILLSVIGPVIEKIGFFPAHIKEAWTLYKTTPQKRNKGLAHYLKVAFRGGFKSLVEDLLVHDPTYIVLMFIGLTLYAGAPVWAISAISFVVAVLIVSVLEVSFVELQYKKFKHNMEKIGFKKVSYYESRFFISRSVPREKIIEELAKIFNLKIYKAINYEDTYIDNKLQTYSGRMPRLRLRIRDNELGSGLRKSAQITYTIVHEEAKRHLDQYRYFPIKKDKIYFSFEEEMPHKIDDIKNDKVRSVLKGFEYKFPPQNVKFNRKFARNEELLVSADNIIGEQKYHILEVKTYGDVKLLTKAMRYVMREFPVVQTTYGKFEMTSN